MKTFINKIIKFFTRPYVISFTYKDEIMTITYSNDKVEKYVGNCTVWKHYPSFKKCSTILDGFYMNYGQNGIIKKE